MKSNVVPPSKVYDEPGSCKTPFTKIESRFSIFISGLSLSKLNNSPFNSIGNLVLVPSCNPLILSTKSNSPKSHDA